MMVKNGLRSENQHDICKSVISAKIADWIFCSQESVTQATVLYTDNHSLYGLSISVAHTTERKLQIDFSIICEAYERRDITDIVWIE